MSTEVEIRAPAEQTEGTRSQILRWLKSVGESVSENEPLIELETDKVTVEVPSPGSGTLREILKQEQDEIGPGELLGRIEAAGVGRSASTDAVRGAADAAMQGSADAVVSVPISSTPNDADGDRTGQRDRAGSGDADASGTVLGSHAGSDDASNGQVAHQRAAGVGAPGLAAQTLSPAVKRLLAERGLDASAVRGTGQSGRITVADVLAHGHPGAAQSAPTSAAVGSPASSAQLARGTPTAGRSAQTAADGPASGRGPTAHDGPTDAAGPRHRVPHTATRKRIAEHMVQSRSEE